ncbi:hypothetical protein PUR61_21495, partial [Streptomyces sp. BE20]|nr:hypothetical protein [Streptomyces sp. BE20]
CTVTFPMVARALADGDLTAARDRDEKDMGQAAADVLLGTAFHLDCAHALVAHLCGPLSFVHRYAAYPAAALAFVLGVSVVGGLLASPRFGAPGLAARYAVGITATAA